jgi:zinc-ribbon domain
MYCPKCGTENADEASFCRNCGANLSAVTQALAGKPPAISVAAPGLYISTGGEGGRRSEPTIEKAVVPIFGGLGFLTVALIIKDAWGVGGSTWWFWLLIPAFFMIGGGIASALRLREHRRQQQQQLPHAAPALGATHAAVSPAYAPPDALPPRRAPAGYAPGSVTEGTTRILERDE